MARKLDLPGYDLIETISEGSQGIVWSARQTALDRIVAIKILPVDLSRDPEAIQRFRREAHTLARLNHPGILQVYDAGEQKGQLYLVLEYVPGYTIADLLERKGQLQEKHALLVAQGIGFSLGYAWKEAGIIHGDLRPENVLVDTEGTIKIADLGLARMISEASQSDLLTLEANPHYVSPEQSRGAHKLDCRSDIYSLGALFYHMVTGLCPFSDKKGVSVLEEQIYGYLPDALDMNPELSPGTAWLIEYMMVKDPALRCPTWEEFQVHIEGIIQGSFPRPLAGLPSGRSTVLRSSKRPAAPLDEPAPAAAETAASEVVDLRPRGLARQQIALPKDVGMLIRGHYQKPGVDIGRAMVSLFTLLLIVGVSYGAITYYLKHYSNAEPAPSPDVVQEIAPPPIHNVSPADFTKEIREQPSTPDEEQAGFKEPVWSDLTSAGVKKPANVIAVNWDNRQFTRGARLFNGALDDYKEYQKNRADPAVLQSVETRCRDAIKMFEGCRTEAPPNVDISALIAQCYGLISDCRHTAVVSP